MNIVKYILGSVLFIGTIVLGFSFGTLWGILAIGVCWLVNTFIDWRNL